MKDPLNTCSQGSHRRIEVTCLDCVERLAYIAAENERQALVWKEQAHVDKENLIQQRDEAYTKLDVALLQVRELKQSLVNCVTLVHVTAGHTGEVKGCSAPICLQASGAMELGIEKQVPVSALGPEMTPMERILMEAVNEFCSCGGAGPKDGCDVCKIWHHFKARKVGS